MTRCALCGLLLNPHNFWVRKMVVCRNCRKHGNTDIEVAICLNEDEDGNIYRQIVKRSGEQTDNFMLSL